MSTRPILSSTLLVATWVCLVGSASAQGPDDPFYLWDFESYRLFRSSDAPSGGMLPLPDPPGSIPSLAIRSASIAAEAVDLNRSTAVEDGDGRRYRDGIRGRFALDGSVPLLAGFRGALAGRWIVGDGRRSGGEWMERHLVRTGRHLELLLGMTRMAWGDGLSGGLLLGRNAPPLDMVRVRTVRPVRLPYVGDFGRLHGAFFLAYLDDRYRTVPFPLLNGTRVEWEPSEWFRLSATRTILFGGAGRTEKLTFEDLWEIWWAKNENLVGERPVSDSDQKAAFTIELRLPPRNSLWSLIEGARLFYEYAGEDSFEGILPTAVAHLMGGSCSIHGWIASAEFGETNDDANTWYVKHTIYGPDSYLHRDYLLGHWLGPDGRFGSLRIGSPEMAGYRFLAWFRSRGYWDRTVEETPLWEDTGGCALRKELDDGLLLEFAGNLNRTRGSLEPRPDPDLKWRVDLTIHLGRWPLRDRREAQGTLVDR